MSMIFKFHIYRSCRCSPGCWCLNPRHLGRCQKLRGGRLNR